MIIADQKLILFNDTGELILARASRQRYDELGRVSVLGGEICWTQPTLFHGRLFVRNHSRAACLYLGRSNLGHPELAHLKLPPAKALTVQDIPQTKYVDWAGVILGIEPEYAFDIGSRWESCGSGGRRREMATFAPAGKSLGSRAWMED